jgi:hypothetical protein
VPGRNPVVSDFSCVSVGENEKKPSAQEVAVAKQQSQTIALTLIH